MRAILHLLLLGWALVLAPTILFSNPKNTDTKPVIFKSNERLKIFIEGSSIDFDYVRRNINFVDFVNDPMVANVHIISNRLKTGSGGYNYSLTFYNKNFGQLSDYSLSCITGPNDSDDEVRECITRTLKLGLMPYVNETSQAENVRIRMKQSKTASETPIEMVDPWKSWVFRTDANGSLDLEESKQRHKYYLGLRADKVTEKFKTRTRLSYSYQNRRIKTNESFDDYINRSSSWYTNIVFSLSDHWSIGAYGSISNSSFRNTSFSATMKPAIEYNFFPWYESDKRTFTLSYYIGPEYNDYYTTTKYAKDTEGYIEQLLKLNFELIQPWGEIETNLAGNTQIADPSIYSLEFNSNFSVRITKGLSLNLYLEAKSIHNQIYLAASEASLDDIYMGIVDLPSTYGFETGFGIRYQFGSIYNNVVNNRL